MNIFAKPVIAMLFAAALTIVPSSPASAQDSQARKATVVLVHGAFADRAQFAADVPVSQARLMAATQRPIAENALNEASGDPAWKGIPSWFIFGALDKNIPPATQSFMAKRAGAKKTVEVKDASHVVMVSHPGAVAQLITDAVASASR